MGDNSEQWVEMWNKINRFLVEYIRISRLNGGPINQNKRIFSIKTLILCIYLQCYWNNKREVNEEITYEVISKILDEFVKTEENGSKCRIKGWFPSLVDGESSFFEFTRLFWLYIYWFKEEEQKLLEEVILPIWALYYVKTGDLDQKKLIAEMLNWPCETEDKKACMDKVSGEFKNIMDRYYINLYMGKGQSYNLKKEAEFLSSVFEGAIRQYLENTPKEERTESEHADE